MGYRIHWEGLSNSSKRAFEWAAIRSETRPDDPSINAIDLLVGVLKLHRGQSEFYQLFDHLGLAVKPFLANFKVDGQPGIDDLDQISKPLSDFPKYDSEVGLILERSFGLTDEFNPETDRVVRLRDLFGGIFTTENLASKRLKGALTSAPIAYSDLVASYPQYLSYDSHEIKYDQFLNQHHRYSAYSGYDSDSRADQDLIGIGPEINGFAYLISSKNLKPPLAIGLFGDWGSGKSYFMDQLRKRIYKITNDVRDSGEPQSDIDIYKSIVQIEFNAWHYVEGELWASLVEHIFSNLQMTSEDKVTLLQQRKKHWLERLGSAQALAEQVKERKETLEIELAEQRAEMDRMTAERLRQLQTLEDLKTRGALGLVKRNDRELDEALEKLKENETFTHLLTALTEMDNKPANSVLRSSLATAADSDDKAMAKEALKQLSHSDLYPALKKNLDDEQEEADLGIAVEALKLNETFDQLQLTLNDLGITETYTDALEMVKAFQELHQTLQRGNLLVNSIQRRGWPWTLALIGVALIGPTLSLLLALLPARIPAVSNVMISIGAFLAALTLSIKSGTHWLSTSLDKIEAAETRLEDLRQAAEDEYAQRLAHLERQYAQKEAEYDQAKLQEEAIILQIAEIQRELQGLTPGSVLLDFIEERVGSDDYRKHLGVAALIRRDFDQLWQLIDEHNKDLEEKDEVGKWSEEERPFSRIVLYIDDLDRCPPDRVVEVLQAVHLLLAFPLFVVVVAVDARWLAQSLQKHYTDLLVIARHSPNVQLATNLVRQATPQDYLEKIFQIPFWIRPLPREARLRMVQGLLAKK